MPSICSPENNLSLKSIRTGSPSGAGEFKHIQTIILLIFVLFSSTAFSQTAEPSVPDKTLESETRQKNLDQLFQIIKKRMALRAELAQLKTDVQSREDTDRLEELRAEIAKLTRNFEVLVTKNQEGDIDENEESEMSWLDELSELTRPILTMLRDISEKPRKVDKLRKKIEFLKNKIKKYEEAKRQMAEFANLAVRKPGVDEKVLQGFNKRMAKLEAKYDPYLLHLNLKEAQENLIRIEADDTSVFDKIADSAAQFFRERGRNLVIAVVTFLLLWWGLLRVFHVLNQYPFFLNKLNPQFRRLIQTATNFFILVVCVGSSLVSLYLLNDWLLLSIAILFIMALVWTSRQFLPRILQELRLIMNLGTVRENERLIWKGVPWLIREIGLYVTLVNERLEGGLIRMPVGELIGQHSRPVVDNEPWFPTEKNDYVKLEDGSYGKVEKQTSEQVILYHWGSRKYYQTADFLSQKPINLSQGYKLIIKFGLDYSVQSRICDEIPGIFKEGLNQKLQNYFEKSPPEIIKIRVHFDEAGPSSLNLIVLVTVDGFYAEDYYPLKWKVSKALVQICNENGLVIPFTQLTLSLAQDLKSLAAGKVS